MLLGAMALLGNMPDAFGQTGDLPVGGERVTYRELVELAMQRFEVAPESA